jgi:hypothetical protein
MKRLASIRSTLDTLAFVVCSLLAYACQAPSPGADDQAPKAGDCTLRIAVAEARLDSALQIARAKGNPRTVLNLLQVVRDSLAECPDPMIAAPAYYLAATINSVQMSRTSEGLKLLYQAEEQAHLIADTCARDSLLSFILNEHANLNMKLGFQDSALLQAHEALAYKHSYWGQGHPMATVSMTTLAQAYFNIGDLATADSIRQAVLRIRMAFPIGPKNHQGIAYANLAESRISLGNLTSAQQLIDSAYLAFAKLPRQEAYIAATLELETQVALLQNDLPRAAALIGRGLTQAKTAFSAPHREIGKLLNCAAEVQLRLGHPDSALVLYQEALHSFSPLVSPNDLDGKTDVLDLTHDLNNFLALSGKAHAWEALDSADSLGHAADCYRSAFKFSDRLRRRFSTVEEQVHLMRMSFPEFERAIRVSFRAGHMQEVFEWVERSKANSQLDDLVRLAIFHPQLQPFEMQERGKAIEDSLASAVARAKDKPQDAKRDQQRWEDSLAQFTRQVQQDYPGFWPEGFTFASLDDIRKQKVLPPDALFVSYFVGDSSIYINAFNAERDTCLEIIGLDTLNADIACLMKVLQKAYPDEVPKSAMVGSYAVCAHRIFQTLVAPILPLAPPAVNGPRRLIIAPDADLSFIPFAALLDEPGPETATKWGQLPYMVQRWNITYINSATHLLTIAKLLRDRAPGTLPGIFGMGTNSADGGRKLEHAEKEVSNAVKIMGGTELLHTDASESALKHKTSKRDIFHVASHGVVNDADPMYSYLRLHGDSLEDGQLHAYEVLNLRLTERLAVLNACQTGRGQVLRGQGVLSMGYAFQKAKCPTVIMSLWSIEDASTQRIFDHFYQQLAQGQNASAALQLAILHYLDTIEGDDLKHPGDWAPFVMVGDGEQTFVAIPHPWWMWLIWGAPLVLALFLAWAWWRRLGRLR